MRSGGTLRSIFSRSRLQNIGIADLRVLAGDTLSIDYLRDMHDRQLIWVRSMLGVEWAEPLITFRCKVTFAAFQSRNASAPVVTPRLLIDE